MIDQATIEEVKNRLVKAYDPLEIYLFGSYAWGKPDEDSDPDLLIVVDEFKKDWYTDRVAGHRALGEMKISKDLLIYTKPQFDEAVKDAATFCYIVKKKGKKIYANSQP